MRFTIIIPTFNRAELLDQAIQSALAQTYTNREILVVDDGSSDDTRSVASKYGPGIRYLRQENQGKAAALNRGIAAAEGEVIAILDDDDLYPQWTLAKHAEALARNPTADFSFGRYVRFTGQKWPAASDLRDEEYVPTNDPRRLVIKLMERCFIPNPAWAVRKEAQMRAGAYDERLKRSQDYDMILRLARQNEGAFVDDVVLFQRQHKAFRGPTLDRVLTVHSIEAWLKYDAIVFEGIDQKWTLSDFRPFLNPTSSNEFDASPSLQKGVILFHRKVYDGARKALSDYRRELRNRAASDIERKIAWGLLGCCHGIEDLGANALASASVASWLRAEKWPIMVRMAFASQLRWRVRLAIASGDLKFGQGLIRFSARAFGLPVTLAVLFSRFSAGAKSWNGSQTQTNSRIPTSFLLPGGSK